jgi:hypothetical protein
VNLKEFNTVLEESYQSDELILQTLEQKDSTFDVVIIEKEKNLSQPEYYENETKKSDESVTQTSMFLVFS